LAYVLLAHAAEEEAEEHGALGVVCMLEQCGDLMVAEDLQRFLEHLPRLDLGRGICPQALELGSGRLTVFSPPVSLNVQRSTFPVSTSSE
jgi:hypothetical protein